MRFGSESGFFRKLGWAALIIFILMCIVRDPAGAAHATRDGGNFVTQAADAVDRFINGL